MNDPLLLLRPKSATIPCALCAALRLLYAPRRLGREPSSTRRSDAGANETRTNDKKPFSPTRVECSTPPLFDYLLLTASLLLLLLCVVCVLFGFWLVSSLLCYLLIVCRCMSAWGDSFPWKREVNRKEGRVVEGRVSRGRRSRAAERKESEESGG